MDDITRARRNAEELAPGDEPIPTQPAQTECDCYSMFGQPHFPDCPDRRESPQVLKALDQLIYVCEKFGIFTNSVEASEIETNKALNDARSAIAKAKQQGWSFEVKACMCHNGQYNQFCREHGLNGYCSRREGR